MKSGGTDRRNGCDPPTTPRERPSETARASPTSGQARCRARITWDPYETRAGSSRPMVSRQGAGRLCSPIESRWTGVADRVLRSIRTRVGAVRSVSACRGSQGLVHGRGSIFDGDQLHRQGRIGSTGPRLRTAGWNLLNDDVA